MVGLDQNVKGKWGNVQSEYQRRSDLIPNLVNTVKGAANFEQETLTQVIQARANATKVNISADDLSPEKMAQFQQAQGELGQALSRLLVVAERYPELKATEAFRDLQAQLEGTENRIAVARQRYIEAVSGYNQVVLHFPTAIGARLRGKETRPTFEATTPGADKAPEVDF